MDVRQALTDSSRSFSSPISITCMDRNPFERRERSSRAPGTLLIYETRGTGIEKMVRVYISSDAKAKAPCSAHLPESAPRPSPISNTVTVAVSGSHHLTPPSADIARNRHSTPQLTLQTLLIEAFPAANRTPTCPRSVLTCHLTQSGASIIK